MEALLAMLKPEVLRGESQGRCRERTTPPSSLMPDTEPFLQKLPMLTVAVSMQLLML